MTALINEAKGWKEELDPKRFLLYQSKRLPALH